MSKIPRNNSGLSGEYFVAAELYRRGWSIGVTIGNAKAVDLFAEKDETVVQVQVKSIYETKSSGWPIMKHQIKQTCLYVFVNLNGDTMAPPDFYICTSQEAYGLIDEYGDRGILTLGKMKKTDHRNKWEKLSQAQLRVPSIDPHLKRSSNR
jgi:hypothetical protein